jgi:hypothetical protein
MVHEEVRIVYDDDEDMMNYQNLFDTKILYREYDFDYEQKD